MPFIQTPPLGQSLIFTPINARCILMLLFLPLLQNIRKVISFFFRNFLSRQWHFLLRNLSTSIYLLYLPPDLIRIAYFLIGFRLFRYSSVFLTLVRDYNLRRNRQLNSQNYILHSYPILLNSYSALPKIHCYLLLVSPFRFSAHFLKYAAQTLSICWYFQFAMWFSLVWWAIFDLRDSRLCITHDN